MTTQQLSAIIRGEQITQSKNHHQPVQDHAQPNDTVDRRALREFASARIDKLFSRLVIYALAAVLGAVFVPVPLVAAYAGLISVTAFAEYFAAKAFLAADIRGADTADPPRANTLAAIHITASIAVAFAITTIWAYTEAGEKILPMSLLAIALLDTAVNGCQILRLTMLRQMLFLGAALAMILRDIMDPNMAPDGLTLSALGSGILPMILLAVSVLLATRACAKSYRNELLREHLLAASSDAAERENARKSAFVATVSHELRTQLNGVLGMAQILQNTELTAQQRIQAEIITDSGRNLNTLLNDILDLTKLEAGELAIVRAEHDLRGTVDRVANLFGPLATGKGLDFQASIDADIPDRLVFDPVRVSQCLSNMIANAVKFTAAGSVRVNVTSEALGLGPDAVRRYLVTATIADTGIGIPAAHQSRLFQPFGQADVSIAHRFGGTGLGLSITRQLAESMGGSVTLDSTSDKGTVFRLTFAADGTKDTGHDS